MNARILAATTCLAAALVGTSVTSVASASPVDQYKRILNSVPKLEMPARAAQEVRNAKANRKQVALEVLRAAVSIAPASAPAVVRAISRVAPEASLEIVATASQLQPEQSAMIMAAMPIASSAPASFGYGASANPPSAGSMASTIKPASDNGDAWTHGNHGGDFPGHINKVINPVTYRHYDRPL
jgi:hypothetical protein